MSRLLAELVIAPGIVEIPRPRAMVVGAEPPDLARRIASMDQPIDVLHITDAQAEDLIRRHDASNNPVDETPALPPAPDMARLFADPPSWGTNAGPMPQRKPPPCAGHSRLGRPFRVGGESRRPGTADAEKRAKRKAAEKSRRRNRK